MLPELGDIIRTNTGDWGRVWVDAVGATSAVPEEGPNGDVIPEKAMAWDPDIIVVQGGSDPSALLDDPTLQDQVKPVHLVNAGNREALKAKLCEDLAVSISLACIFGGCFIQPNEVRAAPGVFACDVSDEV